MYSLEIMFLSVTTKKKKKLKYDNLDLSKNVHVVLVLGQLSHFVYFIEFFIWNLSLFVFFKLVLSNILIL